MAIHRSAVRRHVPLAAGIVGIIASLGLSGCSGSSDPNVSALGPATPKPAESIARLDAPYDRSLTLTQKLNTYRAATFQTPMEVAHRNVLYTAAYRHAVYLNGVNCGAWQPNGATGATPGVPATNFTEDSSIDQIRGEPFRITTTSTTAQPPIFPALFTNNDTWSRIAAVVGSPSILAECSPQTINEFPVVNGFLTRSNGLPSQVAGFNLDTRNNADPNRYRFDAVDNIWYNLQGRISLMRADLKYWAYASAYDGDCICPPWPLYDGHYIGSAVTATTSQRVGMLGYWPNRGNTDVTPYGIVPQLYRIVTTRNTVRDQFSGPPIHFTLPIFEPFLVDVQNPTNFAGGITVAFQKMDTDALGSGAPQSPPPALTRPFFSVLWKSPGGGGTYGVTSFNATPTGYDFDGVSSVTTDDTLSVRDQFRNGEIMIIPTEPLEPFTTYRVGVRLRTASYSLPNSPNDNDIFEVRFRTNGNTPF